MEISLIRHGKSKHRDKQLVTGKEFEMWVKQYDSSSVFEELEYPPHTIDKLVTAKMVVTSDLVRSIDSAQLLRPSVITKKDKLFRETELPIPSLNFKLTPGTWAVILRLLWLCGYSNDCESYHDAKRRAATAAQHLINYAKEYGSVTLVGHGFFNLLIAKQLRRKGWQGPRKTATNHWSCTTYFYERDIRNEEK